MCLVYTALVTPYEIAFIPPGDPGLMVPHLKSERWSIRGFCGFQGSCCILKVVHMFEVISGRVGLRFKEALIVLVWLQDPCELISFAIFTYVMIIHDHYTIIIYTSIFQFSMKNIMNNWTGRPNMSPKKIQKKSKNGTCWTTTWHQASRWSIAWPGPQHHSLIELWLSFSAKISKKLRLGRFLQPPRIVSSTRLCIMKSVRNACVEDDSQIETRSSHTLGVL